MNLGKRSPTETFDLPLYVYLNAEQEIIIERTDYTAPEWEGIYSDYILLCSLEVKIDLSGVDRDEVNARLIGTLEQRQQMVQAAAEEKVNQLAEEINKLRALEYKPDE